jgi:hypothetical protein
MNFAEKPRLVLPSSAPHPKSPQAVSQDVAQAVVCRPGRPDAGLKQPLLLMQARSWFIQHDTPGAFGNHKLFPWDAGPIAQELNRVSSNRNSCPLLIICLCIFFSLSDLD